MFQRVHLLLNDMVSHNPEWHVRMLEIIWACCHEFAHFFISYLNYSIQRPVDDRRSPPDGDNPEGMPEAGLALERFLFGGYYARGRDTSQRERSFMVCLTYY
jgi:hypothetical protein